MLGASLDLSYVKPVTQKRKAACTEEAGTACLSQNPATNQETVNAVFA